MTIDELAARLNAAMPDVPATALTITTPAIALRNAYLDSAKATDPLRIHQLIGARCAYAHWLQVVGYREVSSAMYRAYEAYRQASST